MTANISAIRAAKAQIPQMTSKKRPRVQKHLKAAARRPSRARR